MMVIAETMAVESKTFFDITKSIFTKILVGAKQSKHIYGVFDPYLDCSKVKAER